MLLVAAGYCWVLLIGAGCCWVLLLGAAAWVLLGAALGFPGFSWAPMGYLGALFGSLLVLSWGSPGLLCAFLGACGPLLGSPGTLLGLSWALLGPSWTPNGPPSPQEGSKSPLPEVCFRGLFLTPFWEAFSGSFGSQCGSLFCVFSGLDFISCCCLI